MCWRDDIITTRYCSFCHQEYYGDLGHRDCPAFSQKQPVQQVSVQNPDEPWICDGCKDKPDIKKHKCEVERTFVPFTAIGRFCECECNAPF